MGHSPSTIARWLVRDGEHSEKLHEQLFKDLFAVQIQLDELVTRVRRWTKRAWVWTAQDVQSKAWLAWHVGGRARQRTPAMALGVTEHQWSVEEFITHPVY